MTVVPLTSMPAATAVTGSELIYAQQAAADTKMTLAQVMAFAGAVVSAGTSSDPTSTTSGSDVMMGLGTTSFSSTAAVITPVKTGVVLFTIEGNMRNSIAQDTLGQLRYGTGSAPSNGAAASGTILTRLVAVNGQTAAGAYFPFTFTAAATGLSLGTPYWFDVSLRVSGGTGQITNIVSTAVEL